MEKINAIITGIGGYVPDYVLNNEELSRMVDTNDEWIMTRVGIKERRILTEEGSARHTWRARLQSSSLRKRASTPIPSMLSSFPPHSRLCFSVNSIYRYRQAGTEKRVCFRLLGCLLRLPLFVRRGNVDDTERTLQEDNSNRSRQDVVSCRL